MGKVSVETNFFLLQSLLQSARGKVDVPFVVYPHTGEEWRGDFGWEGEIEWQPKDATFVRDLTSYVLEWIDTGARWIGGCCLTKPKDIARVREIIDRFG